MVIYSYIDLKYTTHSWIQSTPFPREKVNREKQILAASHTVGLAGNRIATFCTSEELKALGKYQRIEPLTCEHVWKCNSQLTNWETEAELHYASYLAAPRSLEE